MTNDLRTGSFLQEGVFAAQWPCCVIQEENEMKHAAIAIYVVAGLLAFAPRHTQAASIVKVT